MKIIVLMWDFFGGGAERVAVILANAFHDQGHEVSIVVGRNEGPNRSLVHPDVPVLAPPSSAPKAVLFHLRKLLSTQRPDVLLSHQTTRNVIAILAHLTAAGRSKRIVVGVEHGEMNFTAGQTRGFGLKVFFKLARVLYPLASGLVAVSRNVADSVKRYLRPIPIEPRVLPNPVVFPGLYERAMQPATHRFLTDKKGPVFVAVGRLEEQKNYSLLLQAFAVLKQTLAARLIIYGVGKLQAPLEAERKALGLESEVDFAGYTDNPFAAMRASDTLVLSSIWEGLPTVAIEALACGAQVVSTDNSTGIREILEDGKYGWITPLGDAGALATAMSQSLSQPKDASLLRSRAADYEAKTVAALYLSYFTNLCTRRA